MSYANRALSMMGDRDRLETAFLATEWTVGKQFQVRLAMVRMVVLVVCVTLLGIGAIPVEAQDEWPQWRGPSG